GAEVEDLRERHLRYEPTRVSKSRIKRLRGLSQPQYRRRVGEVRVFYDVTQERAGWLAEHGTPGTPGGAGRGQGRPFAIFASGRIRRDPHHPAWKAGRRTDRFRERGRLVRLPVGASSGVLATRGSRPTSAEGSARYSAQGSPVLVRRRQVGRLAGRFYDLNPPAVRIAQVQHCAAGRAHVHGLDVGVDALGLELLPGGRDVGHLEGDVVDPDRLLATDAVNLEDRLVVAGKLKL